MNDAITLLVLKRLEDNAQFTPDIDNADFMEGYKMAQQFFLEHIKILRDAVNKTANMSGKVLPQVCN